MKILNINDRMYQMEIKLITDCSSDEVEEYINKRTLDDDASIDITDMDALTIKYINKRTNMSNWIVYIESFTFNIKDIAILAHEIFHLTVGILETLGMYLHEASEEAYAYYNQELTQQIYKKLLKEKNGKSN
jgi:hypothetical protein